MNGATCLRRQVETAVIAKPVDSQVFAAATYLAAKHHYMACGKTFLLGLLFFVSAFGAYSQNRDSLLRLYNNQTITRYGTNFLKGGQRLYFRDLRDEFSFSPMGLVGYELSKKSRTTATVLRLLSVAGSIATLTLLSRENRTATYIAWGGQAALNLAAFYYQDRSNKLLDQAVWQRNKDLLFGQ